MMYYNATIVGSIYAIRRHICCVVVGEQYGNRIDLLETYIHVLCCDENVIHLLFRQIIVMSSRS